MTSEDPLGEMVWLSHEIGREDRGLALPGEGSVAARLDAGHFGIRASATSLHLANRENVCRCELAHVSALVDRLGTDTSEVQQALAACGKENERPSADALIHAGLLQLDDVHFSAHCHPEACLQILCSPAAEKFAEQRMFPDSVLATGPQSVWVPYAEPGPALAREIRGKVNNYLRRNFGRLPRILLLQNHGVIAIGPNAQSVLSALLMIEKSARVFVGASVLGGPVFMTLAMVNRLDNPSRSRR